jgi:hypothetical protein
VNKIEAYKQTKTDPKEMVEVYKKRFMVKSQNHPDMLIYHPDMIIIHGSCGEVTDHLFMFASQA